MKVLRGPPAVPPAFDNLPLKQEPVGPNDPVVASGPGSAAYAGSTLVVHGGAAGATPDLLPSQESAAVAPTSAQDGQASFVLNVTGQGGGVDLDTADGQSSGLAGLIGSLPPGRYEVTLSWDHDNLTAQIDGPRGLTSYQMPRDGSTAALRPTVTAAAGSDLEVSGALYNGSADGADPATTPAQASQPATGATGSSVTAPDTAHPTYVDPTAQSAPGPWNPYDGYDAGYDKFITFTDATTGTDPTTDSASQAAAGLKQAWSDDFTQDSQLDAQRWNVGDDDFHGGNGELESYRPSQVKLDPGNGLVLTAAKNSDPSIPGAYVSGKIDATPGSGVSEGAVSFTATLPKGSGLWPAFWLLPDGHNKADGSDDTQWPATGEIDAAEIKGGDTSAVHGTVHTGDTSVGADPNADKPVGGVFDGGQDYADGKPHKFTVSWDKSGINWYVDGKAYKSVLYKDLPPDQAARMEKAFASGQKFSPIINLAVGGKFDPNGETLDQVAQGGATFPASVVVKNVQVFSKDDAA